MCLIENGGHFEKSDAVIFSRSGASKEDRMFFGFSDRAPRIINRQGIKLPDGFRRMSATSGGHGNRLRKMTGSYITRRL